jgi:hypothetical protein
MATTAFDSTSPYEVLSPVSDNSAAQDSADTAVDTDVDTSVDDTDVDLTSDDADADSQSEESSDAADSDPDAGDQDSVDADADPEAAKASETAWKAKDGNIPAAMKEIIAANPAHAAKLKEMYFTNQRLMKFGTQGELRRQKDTIDAIGGIDKAIALKNQIDELGGEAGFQEAMQELGGWRETDQKWINQDPALVDQLAEANPASFEALAPVFFGKLAQVNGELYDNIGARLITQTFAQDGTFMNMQLMQQALNGGNTALAKEYLEKVIQRVNGLNQMAQQAPKQKAANPQKQAWDQERQQYEARENERFQTDLSTANKSWMDPKIKGELATYLNGGDKKLSANTQARLDRAIKEEIWYNHLANNQQFVKQREALMNKRDKDGLVRLYRQYAPDRVWQKVTRDICDEFGIKPAGKKTATQAAAPKTNGATQQRTESGFQKVTKYPSPDQVDNAKTTFDMKVKDQFFLKDGRKVQVVRQ